MQQQWPTQDKLLHSDLKDSKALAPRQQAPVKVQETTRVKEFPAGNVATSLSRMSFLRSLCKLDKFSSLVDLVPIMVQFFLF